MRIVLIHGFNVRDGGARTVDKLAPYLRAAGHEVEIDEADYGFFGLWKVRFRKHSAVRRIANALEHADAVISHSNGANYEQKALMLLEQRAQRYRVVRLSPAVNARSRPPANIRKGWVFHTVHDWWVMLSALLIFHPWGNQGQVGYRGDDSRIVNRDFSDLIGGHSHWFHDDNIDFIAAEILLCLEAT